MKRTTTIVLFASIFAVAVGTLGLGGTSATTLVSAASQSPEQVGMLGHVEFKVLDDSGDIVQYMQSDNVVVNDGEDCAAEAIFGVSGITCFGTVGTDNFDYIGIGNGSSANTDPTNATLADATGDNDTMECANAAGGEDGLMGTRQVTPSLTSAASGSTGTVVTLDTSGNPFTFNAGNATTVFDSGVFNAAPGGLGSCTADATAGSGFSMFARQLLNSGTGISVTAGDSLSVKWTITVG